MRSSFALVRCLAARPFAPTASWQDVPGQKRNGNDRRCDSDNGDGGRSDGHVGFLSRGMPAKTYGASETARVLASASDSRESSVRSAWRRTDGIPVGPNTTFAGSAASTISIPMLFSCALTIASCVVRVALDAVHVYRNFAGRPLHVQ
jgi:hypothetical protein